MGGHWGVRPTLCWEESSYNKISAVILTQDACHLSIWQIFQISSNKILRSTIDVVLGHVQTLDKSLDVIPCTRCKSFHLETHRGWIAHRFSGLKNRGQWRELLLMCFPGGDCEACFFSLAQMQLVAGDCVRMNQHCSRLQWWVDPNVGKIKWEKCLILFMAFFF